MLKDQKQTATPRKPRADAQRNRSHLLEIARQAFTRSGGDASMDEIAKLAGVGPGTLYRHFPNRDALLEAVYITELQKLAVAEKEFAATLPPVEALRAWMKLFVDYIAAKQIIHSALDALVSRGSNVFDCSLSLIQGSITGLLSRAVASGDIRGDIDGMDLLRALFGVSNTASNPDWPVSAKRLVDILILGSRPVE
ncbi:MAG: TetR/AcrR family transcriptional regulator [Edaphobacter sp.]|uniref:TetR/AcrR family transcriptional regulator n=1 Tax=Edaphobacter sp. TaxID=1934404 RepID=UPI0023A741B4|nr:TetR/AcrR family transcriptional regulator [Edaphobacter sp.]MDE1178619.1 TetR/AcrR family transcriptional regulator [Edaphobacter sp.]